MFESRTATHPRLARAVFHREATAELIGEICPCGQVKLLARASSEIKPCGLVKLLAGRAAMGDEIVTKMQDIKNCCHFHIQG
jgi:hypothetical protein